MCVDVCASNLRSAVDVQVTTLFDSLLVARRLFCLGRLSDKRGGLQDEGRLGRRRLQEKKKERRAIKAGGITDVGNLYTVYTHTHTSTLLKGPFEMWWLGEARGETLLSGELLRKH